MPKPKLPKVPKPRSKLELKFLFIWNLFKGPPLLEEVKFCESRRWKCDFVDPKTKTMFEIEGGIWNGGRHTRGIGMVNDCEKYNAAAMLGYTVIRLTDKQINAQYVEPLVNWLLTRPVISD